jgi:hypothetical protein
VYCYCCCCNITPFGSVHLHFSDAEVVVLTYISLSCVCFILDLQ